MALLLLAGHPRCGAHSPARVLDFWLLRKIVLVADLPLWTKTATSGPMRLIYYPPNFIKGFRRIGGAMTDWRYCGGANAKKDSDYFAMCFPRQTDRPCASNCVCGELIKSSLYLLNIKTDRLVVVGLCCLRYFRPRGFSMKNCPVCLDPHRATKDPWCAACRAGTLKTGPHQGKSFEYVYHSDRKYCTAAEGAGNIDPTFREWLRSQPPPVDAWQNVTITERLYCDLKMEAGRKFRIIRQQLPATSGRTTEKTPISSRAVASEAVASKAVAKTERDNHRDNRRGAEPPKLPAKLPAKLPTKPPSKLSAKRPTDETLMTIGKYQGRTYGEILQDFPGYCRWVLEAERDGPLKMFYDWLQYREMGGVDN